VATWQSGPRTYLKRREQVPQFLLPDKGLGRSQRSLGSDLDGVEKWINNEGRE
jgi:hypothetical protein